MTDKLIERKAELANVRKRLDVRSTDDSDGTYRELQQVERAIMRTIARMEDNS